MARELFNQSLRVYACGVTSVVDIDYKTLANGKPLRSASPYLLLGHDGSVVVQRVAEHVAAHALARLIIEVLKERREVFELQDRQDVVVGVHGNLQQPGELLGDGAARRNAAQKST